MSKINVQEKVIENHHILSLLDKNIFNGLFYGSSASDNAALTMRAFTTLRNSQSRRVFEIERKRIEKNWKEKNNEFVENEVKRTLTSVLRSSPDVIIMNIGRGGWKEFETLSMTGHSVIAMRPDKNIDGLLDSMGGSIENIRDILKVNTFLYGGMFCISDNDSNTVEINEFVKIDKDLLKDLEYATNEEIKNELKRTMKINQSRFIDDLHRKYNKGLISNKNYKIYEEDLISTT